MDTNNVQANNQMKGAVFTLESAAKPKMVLKGMFELKFAHGNPQILNVQIAGDRIIRLEKPHNEVGETILSVHQLNRDFGVSPLFQVVIPGYLSLTAANRMIITDMNEGDDIEMATNNVVYVKPKEYQVAIQMLVTATRETKIVVFNPYMMPLDSLSLI